MTASSTQPQASKKKRVKSAPPWHVLSPKQAKKNVEREKIRREKVRQGISDADQQLQETPKVLSKTFLSEAEQRFLNWKRFNPTTAPAGQRFVGAYLGKKMPEPLGVPEIAFLGRSNVGKSSLLNRLSSTTGDQARVGKTPGATASVNLYALRDAKGRDLLGWVDLPGFGYAKLSRETQESIQAAAENYLSKRKELVLGILLVDIRREPSDDDRGVLAALYDLGVPLAVVATKTDKLPVSQREVALKTIRDGLGLPDGQPWAVSCVTGEGCRTLWSILLDACETAVAERKSRYEQHSVDEEEEEEEVEEEIFDDAEDLVYDQAFDWVGDLPLVYADVDEEDHFYEDDMEHEYDEEDTIEPQQRESLKSLTKKARDMERREEL
jgi:GTP-binding protein